MLHLDDGDSDGNDDGTHGDGEELAVGARGGKVTAHESNNGSASVPGGGGGGGGIDDTLEERPKKRLLPAENSGHHPTKGAVFGKSGKFTPPPPPRRSLQTKGESSWLALRKALHERYRDCEERGAAEQAAAEALERGRGGGSWSNGGNASSAGETISPGLR